MRAIYRGPNIHNPKIQPEVTNVEEIVQSVRDLIFTRPGEVLFDPAYGIYMDIKLFELMDLGSALQIFSEIVDKVKKYCPRVRLEESKSEVYPDEETNSFQVDLHFRIEGFEGDVYTVTEKVTR